MRVVEINLVHPSGMKRKAPVGSSWTVWFFSFFPPLFRGDWKWALIIFLCDLVTWHFSSIFVWAWIYNRLYVQDLLKDGYVPADDIAKDYLIKKGMISLVKTI